MEVDAQIMIMIMWKEIKAMQGRKRCKNHAFLDLPAQVVVILRFV